jgi:hypothetical protein
MQHATRSAITLMVLLLAAPAAWADNSSTYTDFNLDVCKQLTPETSGQDGESSGIFECKGLPGLPVTFAEGDLRSLVAFGPNGQQHCAFHQTFSGFNGVGKKIEWRLKDGKPIATIFRWTVSYDPEDSNKTKTWLVITKLDQGNSCHMGYVEGAYENANDQARRVADDASASFNCTTDKPIFFANADTNVDGIASEGGCVE